MLFRSPHKRGCHGCGRAPLRAPTRGGATRHPPLGNATWKLATRPLRPRPEGRVIRVQRDSPTHLPPQGPHLAGPRAVCHRLRQPRGKARDSYPLSRSPSPPQECVWGHPPFTLSTAREHPGARERPRVGAHMTVTADRFSGVPGHPYVSGSSRVGDGASSASPGGVPRPRRPCAPTWVGPSSSFRVPALRYPMA